jgi:hypothetical protein
MRIRTRGFLIGLDDAYGEILDDQSAHRDFGPVSYFHHRPSRDRFKDVTNQELFYTKNSEWAYEREWRIVDSIFQASGEKPLDPDGLCWPFRLNREAVREVIVGHRSHAILEDLFEILRRPEYRHVELAVAMPDQCRFHLNIKTIPRDLWSVDMVDQAPE